jgi:glycosyltransferase involved in cell wall biosynthesis
MMTELVFWLSVALSMYAYLGYPSALAALCLFKTREVKKSEIAPRVSFIIAAHNEERRLLEKLVNTLGQDYPGHLLEIIVASDCSTDRTDEIARACTDRIRLVRAPERRGKEAAQQLAVEAAAGEILIFSDVATALAPDAVSRIVMNFADPTVGCVSSVDRFVDAEGRTSGEGAYVRYEMWLRALESRVNSLVGLSGSFFAARREACRHWAADRPSDFTTLLNVVDMRLRGVSDPESVGFYRNITDDRREFERKVRTVMRGMAVLGSNLRMLNPFRYGLFSWQLASHKLCRWFVPFALIGAGVTNAMLVGHSALYRATFLLQLAFYAAAFVGYRTGRPGLKIPFFLVLVNLAILNAWCRFARGERMTSWSPSDRIRALPQISVR